MRQGGILLHITSLPGPGGIGTLGKQAYRFVDFLREAGMHLWQMLPVGPTGFGDSPYQSASTYAGNPMLIDLPALMDEGLMEKTELPEYGEKSVDFERVRADREKLLRGAFALSRKKMEEEIEAAHFSLPWMEDYALFMALKQLFGGIRWTQWPDDGARLRDEKTLQKYRLELKEEIAYHTWLQALFRRQWRALKRYANAHDVSLMGDMPIYVAEDSADTWSHPEVFQLDENRCPTRVAGVPPDYFSEDGQLWGNPLYDWKELRKDGYRWWIDRLSAVGELFDKVRIDHFIGFSHYYAIPAGAKNARVGVWEKGPGKHFFGVVKRELPKLQIIAEDLGAVDHSVKKLLLYCGYPGMRVLQFAFDGGEDNVHLPSNHGENCVVYTGTHDNDTTEGWYQATDADTRRRIEKRLHIEENASVREALIYAALASTAEIAVLPMQDLLGLSSEARMNTPGTVGGNNWRWRMPMGSLTTELAAPLLEANRQYRREI